MMWFGFHRNILFQEKQNEMQWIVFGLPCINKIRLNIMLVGIRTTIKNIGHSCNHSDSYTEYPPINVQRQEFVLFWHYASSKLYAQCRLYNSPNLALNYWGNKITSHTCKDTIHISLPALSSEFKRYHIVSPKCSQPYNTSWWGIKR